ncbi:MAG: ParB/RepB/Spo0J family partition protein [Clostridiales bacterium]|nr:ParB/RepB/Spo0J family partition protein [Clostridiales bacterium]
MLMFHMEQSEDKMKSGLGRGLDSLLKAYDTEEPVKKEEVVSKAGMRQGDIEEININEIYANPNQPRKVFDKDSLNELAESIRTHGLIQPIIVNKMSDGYMVIAGERRFRACKICGLEKINAIVKNYTEKQVAEIAIIENLQREDLNPVEMAKGIKQLMEEYGLTQEKVAERLSKSRSAVANSLRILSLYPEVLDLVEKGKVSFGHAKILASIEDYATQMLLAKKIAKDKLTVRDLEKEVESILGNKKKKKAPKLPSEELQEFIGELQRKLGTKVSLIGNDKKGRIYIDYYSQDDLDRLYDIILLNR